jgi:hypothetical protein
MDGNSWGRPNCNLEKTIYNLGYMQFVAKRQQVWKSTVNGPETMATGAISLRFLVTRT